jgi:hypothetical protein
MDCPICGHPIEQIRSVSVHQDQDENGKPVSKIELIVYEQCVNDECASDHDLMIIAVE